jgi:hypothetical protein
VGVKIKRETIAKGLSGDGYGEILEEFGGLSAGVGHEMTAVGDFAANDHTDGAIDVVDSPVGVFHHEVGDDLFFCSEDDSIFALNS